MYTMSTSTDSKYFWWEVQTWWPVKVLTEQIWLYMYILFYSTYRTSTNVIYIQTVNICTFWRTVWAKRVQYGTGFVVLVNVPYVHMHKVYFCMVLYLSRSKVQRDWGGECGWQVGELRTWLGGEYLLVVCHRQPLYNLILTSSMLH